MQESQVDKIKKKKERESEIRTKLITYKDFINKELPPARWIAEGFLPTGLTILAAPGGKFKTFTLLQIAKDVAEGNNVLGKFKAEKQNILFINEESPEIIMQDRLKLFGGEQPENIYFTHFANIKLNETDSELLLKICREKEIKFIIIDSITRVQDIADSKSSDEVKKNFEKLTPLLTEGISVLYTHHTRKPIGFSNQPTGIDDIRDSTDYVNQADTVFMISFVSDDKSFLVMSNPKRRAAPEMNSFKIKINKEQNSILFSYDGDFKPEDIQAQKIEAYTQPIIDYIKSHPGCQPNNLFSEFKGSVGQKAIRAIIKDGEESGQIISKTKKPKTLYFNDLNSMF